MKAEIDRNGTLTIRVESDLEGYALRKWAEDQEALDRDPNSIPTHNLIFVFEPEDERE